MLWGALWGHCAPSIPAIDVHRGRPGPAKTCARSRHRSRQTPEVTEAIGQKSRADVRVPRVEHRQGRIREPRAIRDEMTYLGGPFKGLLGTPEHRFSPFFLQHFQTFWETSTQENLTPEASDRPETGLELLTRISSIRFVVHFLISSRIRNIGTLLLFLEIFRLSGRLRPRRT